MAHAMPHSIAASGRLLLDALTEGGLTARLTGPAASTPDTQVAVWPLALRAEPGGRGGASRMLVRYVLASAGAAGDAPSLEVLDRVAMVVLARDGLMVVPEVVPAGVWGAFGTPPQPAFQVDVPVLLAPGAGIPPPARVREPLRLQMSTVDAKLKEV